MRTPRSVGLGVALALVGVLVSCSGGHPPPHRPEVVRLTWQESRLPVPEGSRALVQAATWCGGRWVVVGATADGAGGTRPAVWVSRSGRRWSSLRLHPRGDYYAARAILTSVGCSGGRLAALGAKSGGAHGLPRTASWEERPDGSLAAVHASYLLYGGADAVAVSRLEGGPAGFVISGTRVGGAAYWTSRAGRAFTLHDRVPGLVSTSSRQTQAVDALADHHLTVVGTTVDDVGRLTATAWTPSTRRGWTHVALPGGRVISTADRIIATNDGALAGGLLDQGFGLWLDHGDSWTLEGTFGARDPRGTTSAFVSGLTTVSGLVAATYSDGVRFRLVVGGPHSLAPGDLPVAVPVNGDTTATVVGHGGRLLLLTDDGRRGRVWRATAP